MRFYTVALLGLAVTGCGQDSGNGQQDFSTGDDGSNARDLAATDGGASLDFPIGFFDASVQNDLAMPLDFTTVQDFATPPPVNDLATAQDLGKPSSDLAVADLAKVPRDLAGVDFSKMKGGCASNADCLQSDYCQFPPNMCGPAGQCMPRPQICNQIFAPVCGCDGMTYSNGCVANSKGQSIAHQGMCP